VVAAALVAAVESAVCPHKICTANGRASIANAAFII
jgi:hypothetical protein